MKKIVRTKYIKYLNSWISKLDRRPLLMRGARQVGKTSLVRDWVPAGRKLLELNFEERPDARAIFEKNLEVTRIIEELELFFGTAIDPEKVVLFFDEVQLAPEAIASLRFFYEKCPALPVIAAGSLLEFALKEISFPVGRVQSLFVRPISFDEFVLMIGSEVLYNYLTQISLDSESLAETAHQQLLALALRYFKVGGMPKALAMYAQYQSLERVAEVHRLLINGYRDDFPKYGRRVNLEVLNLVYSKLAHVAGGSRAKYSFFSRELRSVQIKSALELLSDAHIITKVHAARGGTYPVAAGINLDLFKIAHLDIGLLQNAMGFDWELLPPAAESITLANGRLAEQFVAQELSAVTPLDLRAQPTYWERQKAGSDAEVDFLIESQSQILPIEVKSGTRGTLRSLQQYLSTFAPPCGLVLSANNISRDRDVVFLPFYAIGSVASKLQRAPA